MPSKPLRPCPAFGCGELTTDGRCAAHKQQQARASDARRGTAQQRGYTYRWSQISKRFLERFPICGMRADGARYREHSLCTQQGRLVKAECTDHILARQFGGTDDQSNLQSLCQKCNVLKSIRLEGGFGRARQNA